MITKLLHKTHIPNKASVKKGLFLPYIKDTIMKIFFMILHIDEFYHHFFQQNAATFDLEFIKLPNLFEP